MKEDVNEEDDTGGETAPAAAGTSNVTNDEPVYEEVHGACVRVSDG